MKGEHIMNESDYNAIYEPHPISEVELLGYAKNYIVEVEQMLDKLPCKHRLKLAFAFYLIDEVQEYLFDN